MTRSPPAFQTTVSRFGLWQGAVAFLILLSAMVGVAWLVSATGQRPLWGLALYAATLLLAMRWAWRLLFVPPVSLRWDGQIWHLHHSSVDPAVVHGSRQGRMEVCMDLGFWMLLRFRAEGLGFLAHGHWLPVQKNAVQQHWHALRCTLYSPPLSGGGPVDPALGSTHERP